jgi:arginyl-tRNA synthetase
MDLAAKIMWEKKVCEDSEGAVIVDLTSHSKKLGKAVVKKKDGTSLYLTRDIGAAIERVEKYHFEYAYPSPSYTDAKLTPIPAA